MIKTYLGLLYTFRTIHVQDYTHSGLYTFRTVHIRDYTRSGLYTFRTIHVQDYTHSGLYTFRTVHIQDFTHSGLYTCIVLKRKSLNWQRPVINANNPRRVTRNTRNHKKSPKLQRTSLKMVIACLKINS